VGTNFGIGGAICPVISRCRKKFDGVSSRTI